MPYSFPNNIPRPAKNWAESQQKKCIKAANAVLANGGTEQNAIFACIRAAGKTEHPGGKKMLELISQKFKELAELLFSGETNDEKAEWTTALVNDLPDSSFLYVETGKKKDDEGKTVPRNARHFPYKDSEGNIDLPHLRNAIARIPQSNAPGLSATKKTQLQNSARKMLENAQKEFSMDQVRTAWHASAPDMPEVASARGYIRDVYADHIIVEQGNSLLKIPYKDDGGEVKFGEPKKVRISYQEIKAGFKTFKQDDGQYRWIGVVSNHFRDNDQPREILSGEAHKEYIRWVDKNNKFPGLWMWHVPGSKIGEADMLDFSDGFLVASGTIDKGMEDVAEKLEGDGLTMSHGFFRLKYDPETAVTDRYRMIESSVTPSGVEANPWTSFNSIKEVEMLSDRKRKFLTEKMGEERVAALENDLDTLRKAAEASGVDWKDVEGLEEETEPKPEFKLTADQVENIADAVADKLQMENLGNLISQVKEKVDKIDELSGRLDSVEEAIDHLKKSDDEKISNLVAPKATKVLPWFDLAASKRKDTLVKEGDEEDNKLIESKPALETMVDAMALAMGEDTQQGG